MGFRKVYGANALHLLTMIAGFALLGYVLTTVGVTALWNPRVWWQSIAVWFAAAVLLHDLVLFPLYALADRILLRASRSQNARVPVVNFLRVPLLGSALLGVVFLPGIIEQGAFAYTAATGLTQEPFLGRWLLITAAMFTLSAAAYGIRLATVRRGATPQPPA
jgi:hypothetical protein